MDARSHHCSLKLVAARLGPTALRAVIDCCRGLPRAVVMYINASDTTPRADDIRPMVGDISILNGRRIIAPRRG